MLSISGDRDYLMDAMSSLVDRYGDVPLSFVLACQPAGTVTLRSPGFRDAEPVANQDPSSPLGMN